MDRTEGQVNRLEMLKRNSMVKRNSMGVPVSTYSASDS